MQGYVPPRPATLNDFKDFVSTAFTAENARRIKSACDMFVDAIAYAEYKARIENGKREMRGFPLEACDPGLEQRLSGVSIFADALLSYVSEAEVAHTPSPLDSAPKKRKKPTGK